MTNESIISMYPRPDPKNMERALNLARDDEREKITEETVKEYFAGLNGKETALVVLNYLLRGGITDEDLRGLRLQWIKEQPEENFYCADWNRCGTTCEEQCAACGKTDNLERPQGVDVWVSVDARREAIIELHTIKPTPNNSGIYYSHKDDSTHLLRLLGLQRGECAKFKIVRCV